MSGKKPRILISNTQTVNTITHFIAWCYFQSVGTDI